MIMVAGLIILIVLLIIGVPVIYCFRAVLIFFSYTLGYTPLGLLPTMYGKLANVVLLAIPMFIMAGGIMEKGKIADAIVDFIEMFSGRIKGSLGIISVVACGVFGSICGSGLATVSSIGSIILPKMKEKGYPMEKAAAILCCAGPLGLLIPPSSAQIVLAWCGNLSVLACFLSTVIPGIILMALLSIVSYVMLRKNVEYVPSFLDDSEVSSIEFLKRLKSQTINAIPALIMPFLILGGIYGGIMTPTEAAAVAVFYSVPVALLVYKGLTLKQLKSVFLETAVSTGVVMTMCALIMVLSQILLMENLPQKILSFLLSISDNKYVILFMLNVFLIVIGMLMDDTCAIMLCTPLLLPVITKLGVNPYHFAAILGVNLGMGNITPPTAPFLYLSSKLAGVNSAKVAGHNMTLILFAYFPTLILTTYVPAISVFLPSLLMGPKFVW